MNNSDKGRWLIYGANGYTGELIAREAVKRGLNPIVAGRNRDEIHKLAENLGVESRVFGLDDSQNLQKYIQDCEIVLHCAGPFSVTAPPMIEACLMTQTHYLDITGEIGVFEYAHAMGERAADANVVLCPGVGFDVIPTDCLAATLKDALPDATHLSLGFDSRSGMSPGTAKTTVEGLSQGGKVRRDGRITTVPLAYKARMIDFGDGEKISTTIPWGDVSTAYYSTGIPNIEVFTPSTSGMIRGMKMLNFFRPILQLSWVQKFLKARIDKAISGPSEAVRITQPTFIWGQASNAQGDTKTAHLRTDNAYTLTISGALTVVEFLRMHAADGGAYTPSKLMGASLVTQLPGSGAFELT